MTKQALRKQITKSSKINTCDNFISFYMLGSIKNIQYDIIQTNTCKIDGIIIKQAYKTNYRKFEDTYI